MKHKYAWQTLSVRDIRPRTSYGEQEGLSAWLITSAGKRQHAHVFESGCITCICLKAAVHVSEPPGLSLKACHHMVVIAQAICRIARMAMNIDSCGDQHINTSTGHIFLVMLINACSPDAIQHVQPSEDRSAMLSDTFMQTMGVHNG